jgi:phage terminase small subunit
VQEYLIDLNGTQAAIRAGYKKKNADVTYAQVLGNPRVGQEIAKAQAERARRCEITQDNVLKEIASVGFATVPHPHITVANKLTGLDMLSKHLGMYVTRTEISGPNRGPISVVSLGLSSAEIMQLETQLKAKALQYNSSKEIDHE